ncbi:MAG: hypothetical protein U0T56_01190 [Ferruginibacter sp.]
MRPGLYAGGGLRKVSALDDRYGIFWTGCGGSIIILVIIKEEDSVFMIPSDKPYDELTF